MHRLFVVGIGVRGADFLQCAGTACRRGQPPLSVVRLPRTRAFLTDHCGRAFPFRLTLRQVRAVPWQYCARMA